MGASALGLETGGWRRTLGLHLVPPLRRPPHGDLPGGGRRHLPLLYVLPWSRWWLYRHEPHLPLGKAITLW